MSEIKFKPFIGKDFNENEFKIMILGESHYLNSKDLKDYENKVESISYITKNVLKRFINYKKSGKGYSNWMRTFSRFSNVFNGRRLLPKETVEFWESIIFYNFVQFPTKGPRQSPTYNEFKSSVDAFKLVVKKHHPDVCIFLGYRLWNNFPKDNYESRKSGNDKIHLLKFSYNLPIMVVPHPSSSKFNYRIKNKINNYLKMVKTVGNNA